MNLFHFLIGILAQEGTGGEAATPAQIAAESGGININVWIIGFQVLAFLILIFAMRRFVFGPLLKVIDERRARIEESIVNAEQIKKDLAAAQQNSQQLLNEARQQAQQNIANAQKQGESLLAQSRTAAQEQGNQIVARAQEQITAQTEQAKSQLRQEVAGLAIMVAGKVVRENLDDERNRRLVDETLAEAEQRGGGLAGRN